MSAAERTTENDEQLDPEAEQPEPTDPEETGDVTEPGDDDPEQPEPDDGPEARGEGRCEAVTTVGGNLYRCSLDTGHADDHSFQAVPLADPEDDDTPADRNAAQRAVDEQAKKLDRATKAYSSKVVEALGADLSGFLSCELCEPFYPGLRLPVPLTADQIATLRTLVGLPARANFQQDAYSTTCAGCGGLGKVLTGSNVEQYATVTCLGCKGKGWVPVGDERRVTHVASEPEGHVETDAEREESPPTDPWGRAKGDPDYGRMPGYEA